MQRLFILGEYRELARAGPRDAYVLPDIHNSNVFHIVLEPAVGCWRGIVFRAVMELPEGYPNCGIPPSIKLINPSPHPLIHPESGQINMKFKFPEWKQKEHSMLQALLYLKSLLVPDPLLLRDVDTENAYNLEALKRFHFEGIEVFNDARESLLVSSKSIPVEDAGNYVGRTLESSWIPFSATVPQHQADDMMAFITSEARVKSLDDLKAYVAENVQSRRVRSAASSIKRAARTRDDGISNTSGDDDMVTPRKQLNMNATDTPQFSGNKSIS